MSPDKIDHLEYSRHLIARQLTWKASGYNNRSPLVGIDESSLYKVYYKELYKLVHCQLAELFQSVEEKEDIPNMADVITRVVMDERQKFQDIIIMRREQKIFDNKKFNVLSLSKEDIALQGGVAALVNAAGIIAAIPNRGTDYVNASLGVAPGLVNYFLFLRAPLRKLRDKMEVEGYTKKTKKRKDKLLHSDKVDDIWKSELCNRIHKDHLLFLMKERPLPTSLLHTVITDTNELLAMQEKYYKKATTNMIEHAFTQKQEGASFDPVAEITNRAIQMESFHQQKMNMDADEQGKVDISRDGLLHAGGLTSTITAQYFLYQYLLTLFQGTYLK